MEDEIIFSGEASHQALEQAKKGRADHIAAWQFKPGQSGNPAGRPKGKSLKEYAKEMISSMTDEERQEYLKGMDKRTIWEMAEGKAEAKTDLTTGGDKIDTVLVKFIDAKDNRDTNGVS